MVSPAPHRSPGGVFRRSPGGVLLRDAKRSFRCDEHTTLAVTFSGVDAGVCTGCASPSMTKTVSINVDGTYSGIPFDRTFRGRCIFVGCFDVNPAAQLNHYTDSECTNLDFECFARYLQITVRVEPDGTVYNVQAHPRPDANCTGGGFEDCTGGGHSQQAVVDSFDSGNDVGAQFGDSIPNTVSCRLDGGGNGRSETGHAVVQLA